MSIDHATTSLCVCDWHLVWLAEFIKTERRCCEFFVFGLSVSGDKSEIWLELTGPEGTKDFISSELEWT